MLLQLRSGCDLRLTRWPWTKLFLPPLSLLLFCDLAGSAAHAAVFAPRHMVTAVGDHLRVLPAAPRGTAGRSTRRPGSLTVHRVGLTSSPQPSLALNSSLQPNCILSIELPVQVKKILNPRPNPRSTELE